MYMVWSQLYKNCIGKNKPGKKYTDVLTVIVPGWSIMGMF